MPITTNPTAPTPLFRAFDCPADAYCEAFSASSGPRSHWQPLMTALDNLGRNQLNQRQERIRRMRHEDGATFNPFNDLSGDKTPWALEFIPLPITPETWSGIEAGLIQRFNLFEHILADIYGPQNLIKERRLPAEAIYTNPRFLRPCHGVQPSGNRYLTYYAADVYRDAAGNYRVLRDYATHPAGLGYALENRIVMSRVFSELYHSTQVRRLAPFFQAFHNSLSRRSGPGFENPNIVLLSPGPESRIYFEHALLSRYLGYPLVEGQDLTVRNGQVFLKKLAGLEPVEVIFRHIDDAISDPFALRRASTVGVAGLIQAAREQRIEMVNPIGAGFIDTPMLSVFLPQLCRDLIGEDLLMENHPAWWAGLPQGYTYIMNNLSGLDVGSAFNRSEGYLPGDNASAAIDAAPFQYMAEEPVQPSMTPGWGPEGIQPRRTLLRVFACATEQGVAVLPGGLAMTASDPRTLIDPSPEQQQSKDIWVLSDQPVVPFSLMSSLQSVREVSRSSDLPSRVADNLLWMGRYMERAEGAVRKLRSLFRRLSGEAMLKDIPELPYLLDVLRADSIIPKAADNKRRIPSYRILTEQLRTALHDPARPESIISILNQIKKTARNVRDRLSLDSWRAINRLEAFSAGQSAGDPLELLDDTLFNLSAFSGLAMESMTRGLGWRFMDMGRRVERGLHQTGLICIGLPEVCRTSRNALEALLEISDSIMTYRARYRTAFQLTPVLDLLLVDEDNPNSLAFQCNRLAGHVAHLPRQNERRYATPEERMTLKMLTSVRLLDLTTRDCSDEKAQETHLPEFLAAMKKQLKAFAEQITANYLSRVPAIPHFSTLNGNGNA